ncbi:MAG: lipoprotein signal peptidase [Pseudomonadales bacterium]|nr:lipoprotein signal peptidase [Pseudomonadales bacterium]
MVRWLGLAGVVVLLDQLAKWWVVATLAYGEERPLLSMLSLVLWHNEGAAFSMLSNAGGWQRWFFIALAVGFVAFILYELRRLPQEHRAMGWVYALIMGGAIGNLIDRAVNGYVVDFVLVHWGGWYFPAFNVADAALSVGAAIWIAVMIGEYRHERRNRGQASS